MIRFTILLYVCALLYSCADTSSIKNNSGQSETKSENVKDEEVVSKSDFNILGVDVGYKREQIKKSFEEQKIRYKETKISISVYNEYLSGYKFDEIYFFMPPTEADFNANTVAYIDCENRKEAEKIYQWFYNKYESRLGDFMYDGELSLYSDKNKYPKNQSFKKGDNLLSIYITYHTSERRTYRSSDKNSWRFYIDVR